MHCKIASRHLGMIVVDSEGRYVEVVPNNFAVEMILGPALLPETAQLP